MDKNLEEELQNSNKELILQNEEKEKRILALALANKTFISQNEVKEKMIAKKLHEFDKNNLYALINSTNDLMWSIDRNFKLITSNIPFKEMIKRSFGKVIDKGGDILSIATTPKKLSHSKKQYERAFEGEHFVEAEQFDFPVETWFEISYYPIRKGDEVIGTATPETLPILK